MLDTVELEDSTDLAKRRKKNREGKRDGRNTS